MEVSLRGLQRRRRRRRRLDCGGMLPHKEGKRTVVEVDLSVIGLGVLQHDGFSLFH